MPQILNRASTIQNLGGMFTATKAKRQSQMRQGEFDLSRTSYIGVHDTQPNGGT